MNDDITVPELDELIDGITRKIDKIREYGPHEAIDMILELVEPALRKASEYIARCNISGYTDMIFEAGRTFGDLREISEMIRVGIETGFFNEYRRPCKKCSTEEITDRYAFMLTELAMAIKFFVTLASEYLRENCCPVTEEEALKHI